MCSPGRPACQLPECMLPRSKCMRMAVQGRWLAVMQHSRTHWRREVHRRLPWGGALAAAALAVTGVGLEFVLGRGRVAVVVQAVLQGCREKSRGYTCPQHVAPPLQRHLQPTADRCMQSGDGPRPWCSQPARHHGPPSPGRLSAGRLGLSSRCAAAGSQSAASCFSWLQQACPLP